MTDTNDQMAERIFPAVNVFDVHSYRLVKIHLDGIAAHYERLMVAALDGNDRLEQSRLESLVTMYRDGAKSIEKIIATLDGAK